MSNENEMSPAEGQDGNPGFFASNISGLLGGLLLGVIGFIFAGGPIGGLLLGLLGLALGGIVGDKNGLFRQMLDKRERGPQHGTETESGQAAGQQVEAGTGAPEYTQAPEGAEAGMVTFNPTQTVIAGSVVGTAALTKSGRALLARAGTATRSMVVPKGTPVVAGVANFAGQMGLFNSAMTVGSDAIAYHVTGTKELNWDNATETTLNTVVNLDPIGAVTGLVDGVTNLVGVDTDIDKINIDRGVTALLGGTAWAPGVRPGESVSGIVSETMGIYNELDRPKEGGLRAGFNPESAARPSVADYKYLGILRGQLARFIPGETIDGHNVRTEFNEIDFTKPENHRAYRLALSRYVLEQENIKIENTSLIPRWMRYGESAQKYEMANLTLNELYAAEQEYIMFNDRVRAYNNDQHAQRVARAMADGTAPVTLPDANRLSVDASGVQAQPVPRVSSTQRNGPVIGPDGLPIIPGGGNSVGS